MKESYYQHQSNNQHHHSTIEGLRWCWLTRRRKSQITLDHILWSTNDHLLSTRECTSQWLAFLWKSQGLSHCSDGLAHTMQATKTTKQHEVVHWGRPEEMRERDRERDSLLSERRTQRKHKHKDCHSDTNIHIVIVTYIVILAFRQTSVLLRPLNWNEFLLKYTNR